MALFNLPGCFLSSILRSNKNEQTLKDDILIGSKFHSNERVKCKNFNLDIPRKVIPMCKQEKYNNSQWCSCVNSDNPWPQCTHPDCTSGLAYKTTRMRDTKCPDNLTICQNITRVYGSSNALTPEQTIYCNDLAVPILDKNPNLGFNYPTISRFLLIIIIIIVVLLYFYILSLIPIQETKFL